MTEQSAEHANTEQLTPAQQELRDVRAQRAALQAQRAAKEAKDEEASELAKEKLQLRDEQALNDAIEKYGPVGKSIATVETDLGIVILRRASALKYRRFQDKGSFSVEDVTALVRPCVVWPSAGELDVLLDELPATLTRLASAIVSLAGHRGEGVAKK